MLNNESHNISLSGTIEVLVHASAIPINAVLQFDWPLHGFGASSGILTIILLCPQTSLIAPTNTRYQYLLCFNKIIMSHANPSLPPDINLTLSVIQTCL